MSPSAGAGEKKVEKLCIDEPVYQLGRMGTTRVTAGTSIISRTFGINTGDEHRTVSISSIARLTGSNNHVGTVCSTVISSEKLAKVGCTSNRFPHLVAWLDGATSHCGTSPTTIPASPVLFGFGCMSLRHQQAQSRRLPIVCEDDQAGGIRSTLRVTLSELKWAWCA